MDSVPDSPTLPLIFKKARPRSPIVNSQAPRRLMNKNGKFNVQLAQLPLKYRRFVKDFANTLVSIRWRWVILFVILVNTFFYLIFAGLWMMDAWLSGDFEPNKTGNFCIKATKHFTGYLLLSIESITTTGYGYLYPTENCQLVVIIHILNTIVMVLLDGAFISVVFLKVCKPFRKDSVQIFSKKAVVCLRNGRFVLVLRIRDYLNKHAISPKVNMYLVHTDNPKLHIYEMRTQTLGMLFWPVDVVHEIDEKSPLWNLSASQLMSERFEIMITLSGSSLVTSQFSTSQTSYLNDEIQWGYRFKSPTLEFNKKVGKNIALEVFSTVPYNIPLCSARELKTIRSSIEY